MFMPKEKSLPMDKDLDLLAGFGGASKDWFGSSSFGFCSLSFASLLFLLLDSAKLEGLLSVSL